MDGARPAPHWGGGVGALTLPPLGRVTVAPWPSRPGASYASIWLSFRSSPLLAVKAPRARHGLVRWLRGSRRDDHVQGQGTASKRSVTADPAAVKRPAPRAPAALGARPDGRGLGEAGL